MKGNITKSIAAFFSALCIFFIPFPFNITKLQLQFTDLIFGRLIGFIAQHIFSKPLINTKVYSDSVSMYILLAILFIFAIIISLILASIKKWHLYSERAFNIFRQIFVYYLALQLLKYGADKIFKNQFYTPEPNTLFTPLGKIDKDLLYWSTMGTSYSYNVFHGSLEILSAIFILIKRTRLVGLLLSFGILLNVAAVNFSFDISVKLFSLFLSFLNCYLLAPYCKRLFQVMLLKENVAPSNTIPVVPSKTFAVIFFQWLAIGLICLEVFFPFLRSGNFNGDAAKRPFLHGAYLVRNVIDGKDTLAAAASPVKRFFIHRDGYIIFQDQQDEMKDYKLFYHANNSFTLTDYQMKQTTLAFTYNSPDSTLSLQYFSNGKERKLLSKAIDWTKLPALKAGFHWTMDGE